MMAQVGRRVDIMFEKDARPGGGMRKCGERGASAASTTTSEEAQIKKFAPISVFKNSVRGDQKGSRVAMGAKALPMAIF
jgi:hypothetical protein